MDHKPEAQAKTLWVNHESYQHLPFPNNSETLSLCNSYPGHTTPGVAAHIPTELGPPLCLDSALSSLSHTANKLAFHKTHEGTDMPNSV